MFRRRVGARGGGDAPPRGGERPRARRRTPPLQGAPLAMDPAYDHSPSLRPLSRRRNYETEHLRLVANPDVCQAAAQGTGLALIRVHRCLHQRPPFRSWNTTSSRPQVVTTSQYRLRTGRSVHQRSSTNQDSRTASTSRPSTVSGLPPSPAFTETRCGIDMRRGPAGRLARLAGPLVRSAGRIVV